MQTISQSKRFGKSVIVCSNSFRCPALQQPILISSAVIQISGHLYWGPDFDVFFFVIKSGLYDGARKLNKIKLFNPNYISNRVPKEYCRQADSNINKCYCPKNSM